MQLKSDEELVSHLKSLRGSEKEILAEILVYLVEVDRRNLYLAWEGCTSLFKFCMKVLDYTKDETQLRIQAVRLMAVVPETENKIREGELSLTIAAKAQTAFRQEDQKRRKEKTPRLSAQEKSEVLDLLSRQSCRTGEKVLAAHFPQVNLIPEKTKPVTATRTMIQFTANDELTAKFEKLKGWLGHKNYNGSWEGLFSELADIALQKMEKGLARPESATKTAKVKSTTFNDSSKTNASVQTKMPTAQDDLFSMDSSANVDTTASLHANVNANVHAETASTQNNLSTVQTSENKATCRTQPPSVPSDIQLQATNIVRSLQVPNQTTTENKINDTTELASLTVASIAIDRNKTKPCGANRVARRRRYISIHIRREVWRRAQGCCEYVDPKSGERCSSTHALEIDHRHPHALGGSDELPNLRLLCDAHNRFLAWKIFNK